MTPERVNALRAIAQRWKAAAIAAHDTLTAERAQHAAALEMLEEERGLRRELQSCVASERAEREKAERIALGLLRLHTPVCDHACAQCIPGGEIVIPSFVCAYHEALALRSDRTWRVSEERAAKETRAAGVGSTTAREMCHAAGFDPDEMIPAPPAEPSLASPGRERP